ncbi:MAG: metal ABC transporter permease [bacterium]|jgi:zinc/manganese transport system permease protein|nr:metal ABC transporter permease [bacterium]
MFENIQFLAAPITACIILAGVLSYFGNHILTRGIIFIDIALAQIAALGTMIGLLLGYAEASASVELISLIFTLIIISIFALTKFEKQVVPQEAIIGIIYGLGLGIAMLLAEKIPGGSNYITKTITGNILWVTWDDVLKCAGIFVPIAIIHILLRRPFIKISESKENLPYSINKIRMYELIFYITFGIVVVRSVPVGGIFVIFVLLIAPTAMATLFTQRWAWRFLWSWIIGIFGTVIGIYVSYEIDISNGPAIVCLMGIAVFVIAFIKLVNFKRSSIQGNQGIVE